MNPVQFEGAIEIKKPENMTDDECFSVWATHGIDMAGYHYFETAWKPSYEDLKALNSGGAIRIKSLSQRLVPMAVYTLDENGNPNNAN